MYIPPCVTVSDQLLYDNIKKADFSVVNPFTGMRANQGQCAQKSFGVTFGLVWVHYSHGDWI